VDRPASPKEFPGVRTRRRAPHARRSARWVSGMKGGEKSPTQPSVPDAVSLAASSTHPAVPADRRNLFLAPRRGFAAGGCRDGAGRSCEDLAARHRKVVAPLTFLRGVFCPGWRLPQAGDCRRGGTRLGYATTAYRRRRGPLFKPKELAGNAVRDLRDQPPRQRRSTGRRGAGAIPIQLPIQLTDRHPSTRRTDPGVRLAGQAGRLTARRSRSASPTRPRGSWRSRSTSCRRPPTRRTRTSALDKNRGFDSASLRDQRGQAKPALTGFRCRSRRSALGARGLAVGPRAPGLTARRRDRRVHVAVRSRSSSRRRRDARALASTRSHAS